MPAQVPPALVDAARRGDRAAMDRIVRATYADTFTLAYRLTGNEDDARDVAQDVYLRAWRGLRRFRGEAQFTTWLYRITSNCASSTLDRRARSRTEVLAEDAPVADTEPARDPEWVAAGSEDREVLTAAVAALPDRLRRVLVLRDIYDMPHGDIARQLGISEANAKVRLHRARRRLRDALLADGSAARRGWVAPEEARRAS